jgi:DNA-binding Xre family transcriptional regulator
MIRFRIRELIVRYNEGRPREERIKMETVADAIGVPRSTLAVMSTFNRKPVTNTANLEAVCRFFCQRIPDFRMEDLVEFSPALGEEATTKVDELYPERAARSPRPRKTA